jgi:GDSL-like Lipase/Acylhydrolase family
MKLRFLAPVAATAALVFAGPAPAEPAHVGYPDSLASTGDSITRAFNTGLVPFTDAPWNSWSTGTSGTVNSHFRRILAANPAILFGGAFNDARSGAKMADLAGQVATVNSQGVDYVTILMGANDVCTSSEATMTPVDTFAARFASGLGALSAGSPNARLYVVSIPDVYRLWQVLHTNGTARFVWTVGGICQSLLASPGSTAPADEARRQRVRQRAVDDNAALASVCAMYVHCRTDGGAVFGTAFAASDVSTRDYFHPSLSGQTRLAAITWDAGFDFTDATAPHSTAVRSGSTVTLSATDNAGVSGIEYRLGSPAWQRYTGPLQVPAGAVLTWRAVDVNGNSEATHTLTG